MKRPVAIILGAGPPYAGVTPSESRRVGHDHNVLEWQVDALYPAGPAVEFVGGYGFSGAQKRPANMRLRLNPDWRETGATHSLFLCDLEAGRDHFVVYADILFRRQCTQALLEGDDAIVVAVDRSHASTGRARREVAELTEDGAIARFTYSSDAVGRSEYLADLVGIVRFPAATMPQLRALREDASPALRKGHLGALLQALHERGAPFRFVDLGGDWTNLDDNGAMSRFLFGSKAETLARLASRVIQSRIEPQVAFTVGEWRNNASGIYASIGAAFGSRLLAVRSSAIAEDRFDGSQAGKFQSVLNVVNSPDSLSTAVEAVVASYAKSAEDGDSPHNQVLVQPMVQDVACSGVLFTHTLDHGAPYYVLNYSTGSRTDEVTGGGETKTVYIHRMLQQIPAEPAFLGAVIAAAREIEQLLDLDTLDIEFAATAEGRIHVLQVRPLAIKHDRTRDDDEALLAELREAQALHATLQRPRGRAVGRQALFGIMPDWNPAEIIGVTPKPLSTSLYRAMVMDETWAAQRAGFGYRDLRPLPLMRSFAGHPYVDVRASLNSFIPASLSDDTARRLVDAAQTRLSENPQFHDKIEFEIIPTCLDFDFDRWRTQLFAAAGLTSAEMSDAHEAYKGINGGALAVCAQSWEICRSYEQRLDCGMLSSDGSLEQLRAVLAHCRDEGVLPFAHLARCAFVAVSLIRTAVVSGLLKEPRAEAFLNSIRTVGHDLQDDAGAVARGTATFERLVKRYGHLRPGTYDITSLSYADAPDRFLTPLLATGHGEAERHGFKWSPEEARVLEAALPRVGLDIDIAEFDRFLRDSIVGREYAKFVFTRSLAWIIDVIAEFGERHGLTREDLSYLDLDDLLAATTGANAGILSLKRVIAVNRERFRIVSAIVLPPLICTSDDMFGFTVPQVRPNFIGTGRVSAILQTVDESARDDIALDGAIVLIQRADPGYDWLFGRNIAGLITAYGGANSHMAIRCAEFGLPAAIGVGDAHFQQLTKARRIDLDCQLQRLVVVS